MESILAKLLMERKMTAYALSEKTGIPQSTLSNYVRGKREISPKNQLLIADSLGITVDELIGRAQKSSAPVEPKPDEGALAAYKIIHKMSPRKQVLALAYHLGMSERETMDIGGWSDNQTMRNIYTHLAESDKKKAQNKMAKFYKGK